MFELRPDLNNPMNKHTYLAKATYSTTLILIHQTNQHNG
jgi:hypothetical protein